MTVRVYLADDHAIVRDGLRALLEDYPEMAVVGAAGDGRQAVDEVVSLLPDVVVMDISMPLVNGIEATRLILGETPEVKVIILSMLGTPEHVAQALQAGAHGYLLKEAAGRELVEAIRAVAAGQMYLSQAITLTLIGDYLSQRSTARPKDPLAVLSAREREIMEWVVNGKSSAEIGTLLHLSPKTVESYRSRMMQKLGVSDLPSLVRIAMNAGLLQ